MINTPLDAFPTPQDYLQAQRNRTALIQEVKRCFEKYKFDILLVPTTYITSRPIYDTEPYAEVGVLTVL